MNRQVAIICFPLGNLFTTGFSVLFDHSHIFHGYRTISVIARHIAIRIGNFTHSTINKGDDL